MSNFIRAKGAIFSAIRTMINSLDFDVSMIDDVYIASGIRVESIWRNAVNIGMFPDIPLEKFHYIRQLFPDWFLSDASFYRGREEDL